MRFDNFHFSRSFEFVKDFTISHSVKKSLVAVLVNIDQRADGWRPLGE